MEKREEERVMMEWVDNALTVVEKYIEFLNCNDSDLELLYEKMFEVSEKMMNFFLMRPSEELLLKIEKVQELMRKVKAKQNATAM
jgi:hypothetical protein